MTTGAGGAVGGVGGVHGGGVGVGEAGLGEGGLAGADGFLEAVEAGVGLQELDATAMAVHVAEAADVHEDVEFEGLAGGEGAGEFVVTAAMLGAERAISSAMRGAGRAATARWSWRQE